MTLNDPEWRNGRVVCVISLNSVGFGAHYVNRLKIEQHFLRVKCSRPKEYSFQRYITYNDIRRETPPARAVVFILH